MIFYNKIFNKKNLLIKIYFWIIKSMKNKIINREIKYKNKKIR